MLDEIISYREMCENENVQTLQRGMNFRININYSLVLMSRKNNAPYIDNILDDGITIQYQGHDKPNKKNKKSSDLENQERFTEKGNLTQNGKFIEAVEKFKKNISDSEKVKIYEKIFSGVWSFKGFFNLIDYNIVNQGNREVFIFDLKLSEHQNIDNKTLNNIEHNRLIPSEVKKEVWKRDKGTCVLCTSKKNLHFDHDLPFSKGGSSLTSKNIKLLCMKCNLKKSNKIE